MSSVSFLGAQRWYPGAASPAVPGLDLEVADGEVLALLGPPGSGKSTVLRMLAGLEEVTAGAIHVGDRDVTAVPARDRGVGIVFQNYALHPHLSVAENMGYALELSGVPEGERRLRVEEAAGLLGLAPLLDHLPAVLSGAQRQRVALARAVVRRPHVLCLDEPLSNLDPAARAHALVELPGLLARVAITTVHATRDPAEAAAVAGRVVELRDGLVRG